MAYGKKQILSLILWELHFCGDKIFHFKYLILSFSDTIRFTVSNP